jgi:tagatose 6-phosphate kinase
VTARGGGRVVCVALNPALDITYVSERFAVGEANRVSRVHAQAGGKAVNVARLLHRAGHDVMVTGTAGGLVGDEIAGHLDEWAVPHRLVRCAAGSRRTVSAFSTEDAAVTAYNENGPPITAAEWALFAEGFGQARPRGADRRTSSRTAMARSAAPGRGHVRRGGAAARSRSRMR